MTFKDFIYLNNEEFQERISKISDEKLMKDDIHNCRTINSGKYGAFIAICTAVPTHTLSLIDAAISLRRREVGKKRLLMIHYELGKRGLPVHQQTKRDHLIPIAIAAVCLGISTGYQSSPMWSGLTKAQVSGALSFLTEVLVQSLERVVDTMTDHIVSGSVPGTGTGRERVWTGKLARSQSMTSMPPTPVTERSPTQTVKGISPAQSSTISLRQETVALPNSDALKDVSNLLTMSATSEKMLAR